MTYVVTEPESIRDVYDTWAKCKAAITGVSGVRYQKVKNNEEANAILAGTGVVLAPGLYSFTDGNDLGGVGLLVVQASESESAEAKVILEIATSVGQIFHGAGISGLESQRNIEEALKHLRNVLAELGGLYLALRELPAQAEVTIVHDYAGVGAFMLGQWRVKNDILRAVVSASQSLVERKELQVHFVHQAGHMSTWTGRHDLAHFNARADKLAAEGSRVPSGPSL